MFFLREQCTQAAPFKNTFESIYSEHMQHFVQFQSGEIGFLVKPNIAIAPSTQKEDCQVITGDGETTGAVHLAGKRAMNFSLFYVKRTPSQETMTYRREKVTPDTFLFRLDVSKALIRVCSLTSCPDNQNINVVYAEVSDFLPVIDRIGHFVGLSIGKFENKLLCLDAHELNQIVTWS